MLIGNDLVDLRTRDASGKSRDARFIGRVFTADEADRIASSPDPDRTLWMLWSGKEAAFKIAKKLREATIFAHSTYEVFPAASERAWRIPAPPPTRRLDGSVRLSGVQGFDGACFQVEWEVTASFVHCVASEPCADSWPIWTRVASHEELALGAGKYEPSERELASARTTESLAVRRLARALAMERGLGEVEIVREPAGNGFGPPRLYHMGGARPLEGWDLSLSHDGGLAAAALTGATTRLR